MNNTWTTQDWLDARGKLRNKLVKTGTHDTGLQRHHPRAQDNLLLRRATIYDGCTVGFFNRKTLLSDWYCCHFCRNILLCWFHWISSRSFFLEIRWNVFVEQVSSLLSDSLTDFLEKWQNLPILRSRKVDRNNRCPMFPCIYNRQNLNTYIA